MLDIDTKVVNHFLVIHPFSKLVAHMKQKDGEENMTAINEGVGKKSNAWFITETKYIT